MIFSEFKQEIKSRYGTGYHIFSKYEDDSRIPFTVRGLSLCDDYFTFINEIGFGSFFDGSLVIFPLDDDHGSVLSTTSHLRQLGITNLISIGYDGTTTGYFCLSSDPTDERVYWIDVNSKSKKIVGNKFLEWIESQPKKLFSSKIFAGFKEISDLEKVLNVMAERRKFSVSLLSSDLSLVRPPGKEKDMLPRYNRIILLIEKKERSDLKELTVLLKREGSPVGEDNKEYVTVNVAQVEVETKKEIECYLFDPFNLPFKNITCNFDYRIDLGSKMRVKYKEIVEYL